VHAAAAHHDRVAPSASAASPVATLFSFACDGDAPLVSIPRPEVHVVARWGPSARGGLDVHAFGARQRVHRKVIHGGAWSVTARLRLGAHEAVLGVPASSIAERVVPLDELWGDAATRRLVERLAVAKDTAVAAAILERALAERLVASHERRPRAELALEAADMLTRASVSAVADDLGVSERHLRRVFRETVGMSPKAFAKLARFRRALHAAREREHDGWASIAAAAGYYDQAHLIAECRALAGVTPQALLRELRDAVPDRDDGRLEARANGGRTSLVVPRRALF
jgi:AraC-like DNA-binding protein